MSAPGFYWHDYETWGLNPALDRPSQFAGIRTDCDLNIVGEPDMFYCRLNQDYLPDPESVLITGISPKTTQQEGLTEAEFAARVHQHFSQPDTCVVGYNNIRFDDEFSRYLFYRNFYDPYAYSYSNGSSRWDIIDLVRAVYALRPDTMQWPVDEHGKVSFRLELLTQVNAIEHEFAHDAMSDVWATIAIARLIKHNNPRIFDYYLQLRDKNKVRELIQLEEKQPLVHISGMFGASRSNLSVVLPIAWHPVNKNAVICVDLCRDISPLLELDSEQIRQRLYTKSSELGELLAIPLKLIHINKCPFLATVKVLMDDDCSRLNLDRSYCLENIKQLSDTAALRQKIEWVFDQPFQGDIESNVDKMLYQGFFSYSDRQEIKRIVNMEPAELNSSHFNVKDSRFDELFFRYKARNFIDFLSPDEWKKWVNDRKKLFTEKFQQEYMEHLKLVIAEQSELKTDKELPLFELKQHAEHLFNTL